MRNLRVLVTVQEAEQIAAFAARHGVSVQDVLHRCVVAATATLAPVVEFHGMRRSA
jgi:hypothetical protein